MRIPLIALGCLAALAFVSPAQAQMSPVKIRVESTGKMDKDKDKLSQTRALNIFVTSSAKEPLDLKVKYAIYGRDLTTKTMTSLGDGELAVTVKPGTTEKVSSPSVTATSDDGRGGKKRTDPSGSKLIGQSVQVFSGVTMVAEFYDPSNTKELVGKVTSATPAVPKP